MRATEAWELPDCFPLLPGLTELPGCAGRNPPSAQPPTEPPEKEVGVGAQENRGGSPFSLHLRGGEEELEGGARGPTGNSRQVSLPWCLVLSPTPHPTPGRQALSHCGGPGTLARVGERGFGGFEGSKWERFLFHP